MTCEHSLRTAWTLLPVRFDCPTDLLEREGRQLLGDGLVSLNRLTLKGKKGVLFVEASQSLPIAAEGVVVVLLEGL